MSTRQKIVGTAETILVVEQDAGLLALAQQSLGAVGYKVLVAEDGSAAHRVSEQYHGPIQLLLSDVMMPGVSGAEVANRLTALRPDMGVLLLPKPWTPEGLCEKIRVVLTSRTQIRRILVVDDDPVICKYLAEVLGRAGHQVTTTQDSRRATTQISQFAVEVVITDLVMPDVEGIELICAIREEHPQVKIIAMSGAFGADILRGAEIMGADAALAKPISAETLLRCVRNVSERNRGNSTRRKESPFRGAK